jgi:uncharacterized membrane protein
VLGYSAFHGEEKSLAILAMSGLCAAFAWRGTLRLPRAAAQFLAPTLSFQAIFPHVADRYEPTIAGLLICAAAWWSRKLRHERLLPAMAAGLCVIVAWSILPIAKWLSGGAASLIADPFLVQDAAFAPDALWTLLVPALMATAMFLLPNSPRAIERKVAAGFAGALGLIAVHSLYKTAFGISSIDDFIVYGLAERLVWQVGLVAAAAALWRFGHRRVAALPAVAATAHALIYNLVLHNPLWTEQAVGPLPLLNLLLPVYALPLGALLLAQRDERIRDIVPAPAFGTAQMLLALLFVGSSVRQLFHGALLVEPGFGQTESIAWSIAAIALAVGFLLWGIAKSSREWRIGSLVLMLAAVTKVFLWDASGLEGLLRIASFVALGFSLIGIGWLYARHLGSGQRAAAAA